MRLEETLDVLFAQPMMAVNQFGKIVLGVRKNIGTGPALELLAAKKDRWPASVAWGEAEELNTLLSEHRDNGIHVRKWDEILPLANNREDAWEIRPSSQGMEVKDDPI